MPYYIRALPAEWQHGYEWLLVYGQYVYLLNVALSWILCLL